MRRVDIHEEPSVEVVRRDRIFGASCFGDQPLQQLARDRAGNLVRVNGNLEGRVARRIVRAGENRYRDTRPHGQNYHDHPSLYE